MINSHRDYKYYVECDRVALKRKKFYFDKFHLYLFLAKDLIWTFQKTLRLLEYFKNCKHGFLNYILNFIVKYRYQTLSVKLGYTIPVNVVGPGLSIAHRGTIVINGNAKIGANCRLHVCVNIGASGKSNKAPVIGDNVYIGPGAKIFGDIIIGSNTIIGANAVINKSFETGNIAIGGVPGQSIGSGNIEDHIIVATKIVGDN